MEHVGVHVDPVVSRRHELRKPGAGPIYQEKLRLREEAAAMLKQLMTEREPIEKRKTALEDERRQLSIFTAGSESTNSH